MDSPPPQPLIVTFYSYKGGTGRSMALANVAWILAANGHRVAVIDWDLEAPGLHRYLHPYLRDPELIDSTGIIDFVMTYSREAIKPATGETDTSWYVPYANLRRHATSLRYDFPAQGTVDFVPSGRQGPDYAARVNSFNWSAFYEKHQGGLFLEAAKQSLAGYDYVLIDSRTGVSDTSGICTVQMPHVLVVCFTPNAQSIQGASAIARSADEQRTRPDGTRTLTVLPVMTRVLAAEKARVDAARRTARQRFDALLWHLPDAEARDRYWGRMAVPQEPFYAFEEVLAVFADQPGLTNTMLASMEAIAGCLAAAKRNAVAAPAPMLTLPRLDEDTRRRELRKFVDIELEPSAGPFVYAPQASSRAAGAQEVQPPLSSPPVGSPPGYPQATEPPGALAYPPSPPAARETPRGPATYRYWFYVSHDHAAADSYLETFVSDVTQRIEERTGGGDEGGFFDRQPIQPGGWHVEVADALASSRTFVPILTPRLVLSEYCGKEWEAFASVRRADADTVGGILPVLWTPVSHIPPAATAIQWWSEEMPEAYRQEGLLYLLRRRSHRDKYEQFLDAFVARLVQMGREASPTRAEIPSFHAIQSAFHRTDVASAARTGRTVRLIVVSRSKPLKWMPYGPRTLASLAIDAATAVEVYAEVGDDLKVLDSLNRATEIAIVFIDARELLVQRLRSQVERLDRRVPTNWAYLMVFDAELEAAQAEEVRTVAQQCLPRARAIGRVREVHSAGELRAALTATMASLQLDLISAVAASQPLQEGLPKLS